ncbi:MAG: tripartite tricarboxylate transporter permease [Candidatus Hadarchaeota archaeon]
MLEILALALAGVGLGIVTGLIPGVHVNNITPFFVALAAGSGSLELAALIVAMSIANVFISYIPSTFLGAPEAGTELSVLPAHRLLLEGRGYQAVRLTTWGSLGGLLLSAALLLPFLLVVSPAYSFLQPNMHLLLIAVVAVMIFIEKSRTRIFWATLIFLMSGLLGLLALDTNVLRGDAALMPLLSGLFGASVLLPSIVEGSPLPEQYIEDDEIPARQTMVPLCAGTTAGVVTGVIPAIGPSQGTVLAQLATRSSGAEEFLTAVSSVNTSKTLLSFVALYAIGRARSGAAIAVGEIMEVGASELIFLVGVALFAGGIAAVLNLRLGKLAARRMGAVPYRPLCASVLVLITGMVVFYSGPTGLLVFGTATVMGMLPAFFHVKRTHCMGVIMLPCILYFAGVKGGAMAAIGL